MFLKLIILNKCESSWKLEKIYPKLEADEVTPSSKDN